MTDQTRTTESDEIARCAKCGEPLPEKVVRMAGLLGASEALCRTCTAIVKRERYGVTDEPAI